MGNPKKITIGQRLRQFPAGTINALVEGELRDRARRGVAPPTPPNAARSSVIVRLKWDGEEQLPVGSVVVLGDAIFDPDDDPSAPFSGLQFNCTTPTGTDADSQIAITNHPIEPEGVGFGMLAGAVWAKVDVQSEGDTHAIVVDTLILEGAQSGRFPILWKQSGTGEKWAVVNLAAPGGSNIVTGLLYESIPAAEVLEACIKQQAWDSASNSYVDTNGDDPEDRIAGINGDQYQTIRGSSTKPVRVWGELKAATFTEGEGEEAEDVLKPAVEIFRWSMTQLPGHDTAELEGPYHPAGSDNYQIGAGDDCPDPE